VRGAAANKGKVRKRRRNNAEKRNAAEVGEAEVCGGSEDGEDGNKTITLFFLPHRDGKRVLVTNVGVNWRVRRSLGVMRTSLGMAGARSLRWGTGSATLLSAVANFFQHTMHFVAGDRRKEASNQLIQWISRLVLGVRSFGCKQRLDRDRESDTQQELLDQCESVRSNSQGLDLP
jgi:hypothetical protein